MAYDSTTETKEQRTIAPPLSPEVRLLKRARELIEAGWCQYSLMQNKADGFNYCAMGAIQEASTDLNISGYFLSEYKNNKKKAELKLHNAIYPKRWWHIFGTDYISPDDNVEIGSIHLDIMRFNDQKGRTKEQVIRAFDKAINT